MKTGPFAYWRLRTSRPVLNPGEVIRVYLTRFDRKTGTGEARIGDTVLTVESANAGQLDRIVTLRVVDFDAERAVGRAAAHEESTGMDGG